MIQKTSLLAYAEAIEKANDHQIQVLKCLRNLKIANNQMISKQIGWPINSVTPRVKELRELKLVGSAFEAPDLFTGRKTIYWKPIIK